MAGDPISEVAGAVTDGLAKNGQTGALIEFGVLWTGIGTLILTGSTAQPVTLALEVVGALLCAVGGVPLAYRVIVNIGR